MTTENNKAKRAIVTIGTIAVEVFQLPSGEYVMSQSQATEAIGKGRYSMLRFLESKQLESILGKPFQCCNIPINKDWDGIGNRQDIKGVPINVVTLYWLHQTKKGNLKAEALMNACALEALDRRCNLVFRQFKKEEDYQSQAKYNMEAYLASREFLKSSHMSFQNACSLHGFNAALVHDLITRYRCGKTASELREGELIEGNPKVGLNYIPDSGLLIDLARIKVAFARYRKGTFTERANRAVKEIMGKNFRFRYS